MGAPKIKSNISDIKSYTSSKERYPMFVARVQAGFPSPGDDYICLLYTSDAADD